MSKADLEDPSAAASVTFRFVTAGRLRLHVAIAGPADGVPVVLLHGFPDHWIGWRHQIDALALAGYRVIVPDQRGYNLSDKPKGLRAYALDRLVGDLVGLADALDIERFNLVGHDWGGIVAWAAAASKPERVERLVVLNAPHPDAIFRYAVRSPTQFIRSSYAAFFQFPWLPEALLRAGDYNLLRKALLGTALPGTFSDEKLDLYRRAWRQTGSLTAMLNWYRALRYRRLYPETITAPTLVLWGKRDPALEAGLAADSAQPCRDARIEYLPDARHWPHREATDFVNAELLAFLGSDEEAGGGAALG